MLRRKVAVEVSLNIIIWAGVFLFLKERVEIHQLFDDNIKNIAYYLNTNFKLWEWYIYFTVPKALFAYAIAYWIIPAKERVSHQLTYGFSLMLILMGLEYLSARWVFEYFSSQQGGAKRILIWDYSFFSVLLVFLLTGLASFAYRYSLQGLYHLGIHKELSKTTAAYNRLRAQIKPHFLFNTLNNIYSLAIQKEENQIANSIGRFTETLRYTLEVSSKSRIPLEKEIQYLENYIQLQQLRFEADEVDIEFKVEGDTSGKMIVPMVLINYIENAFKHGISLKKKSFIRIHILANKFIQVMVENSNHTKSQLEAGTGNAITQDLLNLTYSKNYKLAVESTPSWYRVNLLLQKA